MPTHMGPLEEDVRYMSTAIPTMDMDTATGMAILTVIMGIITIMDTHMGLWEVA